MTELITITENNGTKAVSARELHVFLESKQEFASWMKSRIDKYGLIENQDYTSFDNIIKRETGATVKKEYALKVDTAKELAMVEGNDKGKLARLYFIEMEKKAVSNQPRLLSPAKQRNALQIELIELIRENLLKGDIVSIAKEYGFSRNTCENVMRHRCFHPSIVKALYDKAVANKKQLDGGIQSMISNLKNA